MLSGGMRYGSRVTDRTDSVWRDEVWSGTERYGLAVTDRRGGGAKGTEGTGKIR